MFKLIRLYGYELKNAYGYMLKSVCIFLSIVLLCGTLVYGYVNKISESGEDSRMTLGVVTNDSTDAIFPALIEFANNISSLKGFCRLEIFDEKEAFESLDKGNIQMVMVVPSGFMDAAEHMQETEVMLYSKGELTAFQYKVLGMFHGVEGIMLNTEGSIRAMYSGMEEYTFNCTRNEMENRIMELYIYNFLGREDYFESINVSAYGDYSAVQYYIIALLLVLISLQGVIFLKAYNRQQKRVEMIMSRGNTKILTSAMKIVCIALPIITEMWILLLTAGVIIDRFDIVGAYIEPQAFALTILIGFSIAAMVNTVATLFDKHAQRVTVYMLLIVLLSLLSGTLCSIYYLPSFLRKIVEIWPINSWHQMLMGTVFGSVGKGTVTCAIIEMLAIMLVGLVIYTKSLASHD